MLNVLFKSHNVLRATLTDSAGATVTGSTVLVTITDKSGTALVTAATMVDGSDGTYDYTISNSLLPTLGEIYIAKITSTKSGDIRYVEISLKNVLDTD